MGESKTEIERYCYNKTVVCLVQVNKQFKFYSVNTEALDAGYTWDKSFAVTPVSPRMQIFCLCSTLS